jgi:hypothetical protein
MNPDKWERVKAIFNSALELSSDERGEYLESVCGPDSEIRQAVQELIGSYRTSRASILLSTLFMGIHVFRSYSGG